MLSQLARLIRSRREFSTFLMCALVSFVLFALPPQAKDTTGRVISGVALGPFKRLTMAAAELGRVREENAALRRLAVELMNERAALVECGHENERLRELLSVLITFPEQEHFEMLPARVIGMPGSRVVERIELDKGSEDGVRVGMSVVVPDGLVGKISSVHPGRALVEPLASASFAVSVVVERSRVRGIVRPRYQGASRQVTWEMDYVPARSDVAEGDRVTTSGLGGVFPAGLSVGEITHVEDGPLTMSVGVAPAVDFSTIEQVFVLTGTKTGPREITDAERRLLDEMAKQAADESGS